MKKLIAFFCLLLVVGLSTAWAVDKPPGNDKTDYQFVVTQEDCANIVLTQELTGIDYFYSNNAPLVMPEKHSGFMITNFKFAIQPRQYYDVHMVYRRNNTTIKSEALNPLSLEGLYRLDIGEK